jgi:hypothetical protein
MDLRTLALGLGVFCATFVVGWWLNIGTWISGGGTFHARPAVAATPTQQSSTQVPPRPLVVHVPSIGSHQAQPKPSQHGTSGQRTAQVKDTRPAQPKAQSRRLKIRLRRR